MIEILNPSAPSQHGPLLRGHVLVHVLHGEVHTEREVTKGVFNIYNSPPEVSGHIEARISAMSFSPSVRHETPLLNVKN